MHSSIKLFAAAAVLMLAATGCQSRQAKVDALQKEYDDLAKQFHQDCSAQYLSVPPKVSPKCEEEDTKVKNAWDRLQAERAQK